MEKSSRIVEDHQLLVLVTLPKEPPDLVWYHRNLLPWPEDPFMYWLGHEDNSGEILHYAITNLIDIGILQAGSSGHAVLTPLSVLPWVDIGKGNFIHLPHRPTWRIKVLEPVDTDYMARALKQVKDKMHDQN